jgi:hypothetical protein
MARKVPTESDKEESKAKAKKRRDVLGMLVIWALSNLDKLGDELAEAVSSVLKPVRAGRASANAVHPDVLFFDALFAHFKRETVTEKEIALYGIENGLGALGRLELKAKTHRAVKNVKTSDQRRWISFTPANGQYTLVQTGGDKAPINWTGPLPAIATGDASDE